MRRVFRRFPGFFDPSLDPFRELASRDEQQAGRPLPLGPGALFAVQALAAVFVAPIINSVFVFGEEFGWRAYLLPKLLPLGERRAVVATGAIWGAWHWPLVTMGYEYSRSYPGWPYLGMLAMVWFTLVVGILLGWLALQAGSVWPAIIGHATINATGGWAYSSRAATRAHCWGRYRRDSSAPSPGRRWRSGSCGDGRNPTVKPVVERGNAPLALSKASVAPPSSSGFLSDSRFRGL